MDARSRYLYDLGRADLDRRFHAGIGLVRDPFYPERHSPHHSLWLATYLLDAGDTELAAPIVEKVLTMQELRPGDPHYGNFRWHYEDPAVIDLNACQFVMEALLHMPLERLPGDLRSRVHDAIHLALAEAERLDVHWTYTNIYLHDVQNRILGGELLGDEAIARAGRERLEAWAERTREVGAPHEFNSPTYAAVDLNALANVASRSTDDRARQTALEMEGFLWRHFASHWHMPTMQLAGPHSRAYRRDTAGAPGFLKVVLYKLLGDEQLLAGTPYYEGYAAEGAGLVARTEYHCPPDAAHKLRQPATRTVCETVALDPRTEITTHVTPEYALGTATRKYGVGGPPEPWPMDNACLAYWKRDADPGYGVLYTRYRINAGPIGEQSRESASWHDIWEDGVFRSVQSGGNAIVGYGLTPRGQRPITSLRLDIRLLGVPDHAIQNVPKEPGQPLVIVDHQTIITIIPLAPTQLGHTPPVTLWRDADELVLSITNYEGPPKQFWEYRSLAGPFYKGNVANGFALSIASIHEPPPDMHLSERTDGALRQIAFNNLTLEYDLRDLHW